MFELSRGYTSRRRHVLQPVDKGLEQLSTLGNGREFVVGQRECLLHPGHLLEIRHRLGVRLQRGGFGLVERASGARQPVWALNDALTHLMPSIDENCFAARRRERPRMAVMFSSARRGHAGQATARRLQWLWRRRRVDEHHHVEASGDWNAPLRGVWAERGPDRRLGHRSRGPRSNTRCVAAGADVHARPADAWSSHDAAVSTHSFGRPARTCPSASGAGEGVVAAVLRPVQVSR
jgi:hypothetical protein